MTRETKIGLLVGLAFIIVIGILLSDYNRIESPTAPLFWRQRQSAQRCRHAHRRRQQIARGEKRHDRLPGEDQLATATGTNT